MYLITNTSYKENMKRLRRITAVILAMVMVLSTMTNVFAAKNDKKLNFDPYNYVSIGIVTSDGKYKLADIDYSKGIMMREDSKAPWVNVTGKFYSYKDSNYGVVFTTYINNRSNNKLKITANTEFKFTVKLVDDKKQYKNEDILIKNISDYRDSGKSFYEYCHNEYNSGSSDKIFDMIYTLDSKYTVKYVDDNKVVKNDEVKERTEYTVNKTPKANPGYSFEGWSDGQNTYKNGTSFKMPVGDVTLTAVWEENLYTVTYTAEDGVNNLPNGAEGLKKGDVYTISSTEPTKEGYTFVGWSYDNKTYSKGDEITVGINNIELKAAWEENLYTVTYKVNGKVVDTIKNVKHGATVPAPNYTPADNMEFFGWDYIPETVTDNIVINGSASVKTYMVQFEDENGRIISRQAVVYGNSVTSPKDPVKKDVKVENGTEAAQWSRFTFAKWVAAGDYDLDALKEVKQDMTFKASYTEKKVEVYFFVLNRGTEQKEEPGNYSSDDYSKGVKGTLKYFKEVNNNDAEVQNTIFEVPSADKFGIELGEGETIKWYVVKKINSDKWHIDGIIAGQQYDVEVEYIDAATKKPIRENTVNSFAATEEYKVALPEIEGYELVDKDTTVSGVMPYENVKVTVEYQKVKHTVSYKVNGEVEKEYTVEYGDDVPTYEYEVAEGYDFTGFEVVTGEEDATVVKQDMVFEGTATLKTFTVTYKVDGEEYETFTVEYGKEIPASTYEVAEGYEFSGFELVTEVEDATVVKQNMVFEGTTNEIVVEEEEDIELDTPFAPGTGANDNNDVDDEEEEDITLDTPFASGTKGTANNNDVDADEEEGIDLATPFS